MNKTKRIAIFTLFLDTLGLTIIIPVFPNLVEYYATSYFMISLGVTFYSLFGLISTPILGALSDKYGRKIVLIVSVASTVISNFILVVTGSIWMYIVARIVNGAAAGNISSVQSILSDISKDHKERANSFGLFGAVFGIGFIIGPALGARLLHYGVKMPFILSLILSIINIIFIIWKLPETNKVMDKLQKVSINIFRIFKDMFVSAEKKHYFVFFIINLAIMIYQMSFTLFLSEKFGISGEHSGYIMALFGVIMAINQGLLLKVFWLKRFSYKALLSISLLGMIGCYLGAFLWSSFWPVVILVALSGVFQGIFRPVFSNMILGNNEKEVGLINGNMSALMNLANIFGPLFGGYLIDAGISPFGAVALLLVLAYWYAKKHISRYLV